MDGTSTALNDFVCTMWLSLVMLRLCSVAACWLLVGLFSSHAQTRGETLTWRSYEDPRTGTKVDFPAGLFPVDAGDTERGTGRVFKTADGRATFSAYMLENEDRDSPRSYLRKFLKVDPATIDYRRVTQRFFAVSGVRGALVYYSRSNFYGRMHCIYMSYPAAELRAWDAIVTRVSLSLRGARN
jgi:hypothetical protein